MKPLLAIAALATLGSMQPDAGATFYVGGRWYDGNGFVDRTAIVRHGVLDFAAAVPAGAEIVDLAGGYVIPPFCEGHNHDIAAGAPEERNRRYLAAGTFYAQILNNEPAAAQAQRAFWQRPDTVDVAFANGGLTGAGGHPVEVLEGIRRGGGYGPGAVIADRAYYEVDSDEDLDRKWPLLLATRPDVVKFFLQFSEEHERRRDDPAYYGNRGLSPAGFRRGVGLAHAAGLRVAAHVVSAADFRLAVEAGADIVAHLPGYMSVETIAEADAALAAERRVWVITTASLAASYPHPGVDTARLRSAQIDNLRRLRAAGVRLALGSDTWGDTSHGEAAYLRQLGVFDDRELLNIWTRNCPQMIYPDRRIGELAEGAEANFLVLGGNPLEDFAATRQVRMRVKQGRQLDPE